MSKPVAIIAALNEEQHIHEIVVRAKRHVKDVIVVSDGSTDNTDDLATRAGAIVLRHNINLGKGAAMKTGAEFALRKGFDKMVFLDGDGQHEPKEIPRFLKELEKYAVVFGARKRDKNMPYVSRFGNWFLSFAIKLLYGVSLRDSQGGYRAIRTNVYDKLRWESTDYSVESEIIAHMGQHKLPYKEIVIKTIYHDSYKGTTPLHGVIILLNLLLWRVQRVRK